jgi:photosystem II stability/assembly factor-like uncharacterized protein
MKRAVKFYIAFLLLLSISIPALAKPVNNIITDTTKQPTVQYRRGVELLKGYQTYEQKYAGKNLLEEKKSLYPLGYGTSHPDEATSGTGVWTELNPKVPRVDYLGIHFVNPDTGWACGDLGTVIKSIDGGSSWTVEQTNTTTPILKVNSYNGNIVIACGFGGLILRSGDGGESWAQVTSGVTGDLWGLQMINDTLGWSCGTGNSLVKTTDGGQNWQTITTPGYTANYWWIDFMDENYGFIAGDGKVLRTANGGNNWDIIQAGDAQSLYSIDVIDSLHIAAAGYGGTSYRGKNIYSSDGGNTWITGGLTTFDPINCIKYINVDTGYIDMSEVGIWKTTNQGQNWTPLDSTGLGNIGEYEIQFFNKKNIGYDAGSGLRIFKAEGNLDIWHKLIINDDLADVFFTSEQKGFVIRQGIYGTLFRTTDGGMSWDTVQGVPGGGCITFTDSLTGYIGTTTSQIYKTTNGGENWYQTNGITNIIAKIFFINSQTGWAGGGPIIFKTTDGGEDWFEQLYHSSSSFKSVYFVDSLYGWTAGGDLPYKTTDGGENWILQNNNFYQTNDVYFTDHNIGRLIDDLNLYKTTNSGINWFTQLNSQYIIKTFGWLSKSHGFIIGDGVYETVDTGNTWNEILELRNIGLRKLQGPLSFIAYSVGKTGLIYKYVDTSYTPVELTSFTGNVTSNNKLQLLWTTATEKNNYGFEIQKSADQILWKKVGFIEGYGTSTEKHSYSFADKTEGAGIFYYRLKQIDYNGGYKYSNIIEVNVNPPLHYYLSQNYPNPFNPTTTIDYTIPEETYVSIKLYDLTGREVKELVNEKEQPGYYTIKLKGGELSSGVYFYRLLTGSGYTAVKKLIILK